MRLGLRILGLIILLGATGFWLAKGANRGWSKHSVAIEKTDEITGIPYREYEPRYVPGIEVAAGGGILGLVLIGLSLLRRPPPSD